MAQCPTCFSIIGTPNPADFIWTDDPILTPEGLSGVDFIGFTQIKAQQIKELQDNRKSLEASILSEANWTDFTTIDTVSFWQNLETYLRELRVSTEKLLTATGISKETYFNYDYQGTDMKPGNHKLDWTDAVDLTNNDYPQPLCKFHTKAIHIEDLRHFISAIQWKESFDSGKLWYSTLGNVYKYSELIQPGDLAPDNHLPATQITALNDSHSYSVSMPSAFIVHSDAWALGASMLPAPGLYGDYHWVSDVLDLATFAHSGGVVANSSANWSFVQSGGSITAGMSLSAYCGGLGSAFGFNEAWSEQRYRLTSHPAISLPVNASIDLKGLARSHADSSGLSYADPAGWTGRGYGAVVLLVNVSVTIKTLISYDLSTGIKQFTTTTLSGKIPFAYLSGAWTGWTSNLQYQWFINPSDSKLWFSSLIYGTMTFKHWYDFATQKVGILDAYNYVNETSYDTTEPIVVGDSYATGVTADVEGLYINQFLMTVVAGAGNIWSHLYPLTDPATTGSVTTSATIGDIILG